METVIQFKGTIYEKGYGLIAQKVMRDRDLDPKAKAIYAYICSFAGVGQNGERTAFPGVKIMMSDLGIKSEDTYYKYRKQLIVKGYISIEKQRQEGAKFDNNLYIINAMPNSLEKEFKTHKTYSPPPKNQSMEKKPYPNFPSTENSSSENPSTENWGNNINSNNINSNNINRLNQNQNLNKEIYNLKIPIALRRFLLEKVSVLGKGEPDIFEIENFFNTSDLIDFKAGKNDIKHLNEFEFINVVKAIFLKAKRPVYNTRGILVDWCLKYLSFKREGTFDQINETNQFDLFDNHLAEKLLKK